MRPIRYIGLLVLLLVALSAFGQNDARIAAQRKAIAELEQKIAREEAEKKEQKKALFGAPLKENREEKKDSAEEKSAEESEDQKDTDSKTGE